MSVSYSKSQRDFAKVNGLHLVTIAVPGMEFQGPSSAEEVKLVSECMLRVLEVRRKRLTTDKQQTEADAKCSDQE